MSDINEITYAKCGFAFGDQRIRRWTASGEAPVPSNVKNFTANKLSDKILNMVAADIAAQYRGICINVE
ncbi:MAG: hypothetical protein JXR78_05245 [Victivallales bacterium]|nr:hypothetical protein [Victivallales bacterium]